MVGSAKEVMVGKGACVGGEEEGAGAASSGGAWRRRRKMSFRGSVLDAIAKCICNSLECMFVCFTLINSIEKYYLA